MKSQYSSLFFHASVEVKSAKCPLELGISGKLTVFVKLVAKLVVVARTEWNTVFQVIFVFKKKVRGFFPRYLEPWKCFPVFFIFGSVFEEMLMFELNLSSHFSSAHGEFGDRAMTFAGAGLTSGAFLVIFFASAVVDDFEGVEVGLCRVLVLILHAFKQIIL